MQSIVIYDIMFIYLDFECFLIILSCQNNGKTITCYFLTLYLAFIEWIIKNVFNVGFSHSFCFLLPTFLEGKRKGERITIKLFWPYYTTVIWAENCEINGYIIWWAWKKQKKFTQGVLMKTLLLQFLRQRKHFFFCSFSL